MNADKDTMFKKAREQADENCFQAQKQRNLIKDFEILVRQMEANCTTADKDPSMRNFLTEDMYHCLCETPMGTQDILGMVLGERLGLSFKERQTNCFVYTMDNGWELEIPTYNGHFVRLIIGNQFLKQNIEEDFDFCRAQKNRDYAKGKIEKWKSYSNISDTEKAKMVYVGAKNVNPILLTLCFKAANLTGKYDKKVRDLLEDNREQYRINTEVMQKIYAGYAERYRKQRKELCRYAEPLLDWTGTILVYRSCDRGYSSMSCMTIHSLADIPEEAILSLSDSLTEMS